MTENVTLSYIGPFDFTTLYGFLNEALHNTTDPLTSPYFQTDGQYLSITNDVCLEITGATHASWAIYDNQGIWNRIVTWKLPLVTLLFQFARPPFAFRWLANTNVFIMVHLVGNPIGTIASLLFTVQMCRMRVGTLREYIVKLRADLVMAKNPELARRIGQKQVALLKSFGLICISYGEWRVEAMEFSKRCLNRILKDPDSKQSQTALRHVEVTASLLAADRSTYILPIFIAQAAFVFSIGAAFWRTIGVEPQPQSWVNVEAYSIAMSAPFLAILPAVFFSAIIGVAQTETSVPRILNNFRDNLRLINGSWDENLEEISLANPRIGEGLVDGDGNSKKEPAKLSLSERIANGAIYAWRPDMLSRENIAQSWPLILVSSTSVLGSIFVAGWISFRVPPIGFDCRNKAQMALLGVWGVGFVLDFVLTCAMDKFGHLKTGKGYWYEIMFVKDTIMVLAAVTLVMVTQFGIFNRCDCYTLWGRAPLALPQIFEVKVALMDRIRLEWPLVTFGWIAAELVLCVLVWWWYRDAFGVYTQMDDGTSNIPVAVSSLWRRVFRKRRDSDGALAVHGVEPQGPGPEIPLLRLSGDAKSRSPSAQGDRMNTTGLMQTRPPSDEWGSAARAELNFGR